MSDEEADRRAVEARPTPAVCPDCGATKDANGEREHRSGCSWLAQLLARRSLGGIIHE